jgi:hypothetical protein
VAVPRVTEHLRTNLDVLDAFGAEIEIETGEPAVLRTEPLALGR